MDRKLRGQVAIEWPKKTATARHLRGQVATEFFLYTSVFMFIVIAAFFIVNHMQSTEIPLRENTIAKETGEFFSSSIALAVRGGQGFTYNYTFPRTILGTPYTLAFSDTDKIMVLEWQGRYAKFSQIYSLPNVEYDFPGTTCGESIKEVGGVFWFNSSACDTNVLTLENTDGKKLTVIHND